MNRLHALVPVALRCASAFAVLATGLASGLAVTLVVDVAEAKPKDRPVAIYVEGPDAEAIGGDVVDALPSGLTMKDPAEYKAELGKAGQKGALGKGLDSDKQKTKLYEKLRKAATAAGVDAVIVVRTTAAKGQTKVKLVVLETESDLVALETEITLPAKGKKKKEEWEKERAAAVAEVVEPALKKLAPAPEPEPEPKAVVDETPKDTKDAKDEEPEEPGGPREKHVVSHSLFDVGVGVDIGFRSLSFTDKKTNNVRGYSVNGTPGIYLAAEVYPLAGGKGFLKDLGLQLEYAQAIALKSSVSADASGTNLATTWRRWMLGLHYRIRTGEKAPVIGLGVGYGAETFSIDATGVLADQTPSVDYKIIRLGADIRQSFGGFSLLANFAYLVVPSGGPIADRFTESKMSGAEFGLGAAYMVTSGLEVRVLGRYRHVGYTFSPKTGDLYVASGASDNLESLTIGAAYVF